jgi:hypothetical protein
LSNNRSSGFSQYGSEKTKKIGSGNHCGMTIIGFQQGKFDLSTMQGIEAGRLMATISKVMIEKVGAPHPKEFEPRPRSTPPAIALCMRVLNSALLFPGPEPWKKPGCLLAMKPSPCRSLKVTQLNLGADTMRLIHGNSFGGKGDKFI